MYGSKSVDSVDSGSGSILDVCPPILYIPVIFYNILL